MIAVDAFTGEVPRSLARLLPNGAAAKAIDCDFAMGALTGIIRPERVVSSGASAQTRSLYIHDSASRNVHYWDRDVIAVRGPIADDRFERFYWLDAGTLYVSRGDVGSGEPGPDNRYKAGVPFPQAAPVASAVDGVLREWGAVLFREDVSGTVLSEPAPVPMNGTLVSQDGYQKTFALRGDTAALMASNSGTWALRIQTPMGVGTVRPSSGALPTVLPPDLADYSVTVTQNGDHFILRVAPDARKLEARAYVYTYVNQYGEESAPSDPASLEAPASGVVSLTLAGCANDQGYCPVSRIRLYRTETGNGSTSFLFHSEHDNAASVTVTDNLPGESLGEPLQTSSFYPPESGLETLAVMANGMLVASRGNQIYIAEQYLPYAWRPENVQVTQHRVVGLCAAEGGMYVTTTSHPYFLAGQTPDACTLTKITAVQAGVSRRSICNVGDFVVWASHDGLVMARGVTASLDWSHRFFTREIWRARYRDRLHAMRLDAHDGNLLIWFTDGHPGALIRFDGEDASLTGLTQIVNATYADPLADALFIVNSAGTFEFKGAPFAADGFGFEQRSDFAWRSKDFVWPMPTNLGAVRILGGGYLSCAVHADGNLIHVESVTFDETGAHFFRLPSGFLARVWSFEINGRAGAHVSSVRIAPVPSDVRRG